MKLSYNNYIKYLSERFERRLDDIYGVYGFEYGAEFEIAICEIIRDFLPNKYGICRGFVVDKLGNTAGDDIIIYDQDRFPTLKLRKNQQYARKEMIPIEAVYAYIEVKHTINFNSSNDNNSILKALNQVRKVKELCSTRKKVELGQIDPQLPSLLSIGKIDDLPPYRNPIYTAIISRNVEIDGKVISNVDDINKKLFEYDIDRSQYNPELIIFGKSNFLSTGYFYNDNSKEGIETLFQINDKRNFYGVHKCEDFSFGLFLAYLFSAIDFIRLGRMPWVDMINEVIKKD
jgi:hypothetical protein